MPVIVTKGQRRFLARQHACPKCAAPRGVACSGKPGRERKSVHRERMVTAGQWVEIKPGDNFYLTPQWRAVRYRALRKYGGCCQCCGARATPNHPIHVDHIKPRSRYPELSLRLDNLQVLCEDCNKGKSDTDTIDWRIA